MANSKSSKQKITVAQRRASAAALRRLGLSYREIGEKLDISRQAAYRLVASELERMKEQATEDLAAIRALELERLDHWLALVSKEIRDGHVLAGIDRGLRIMERRAKLLGLDANEAIDLKFSTKVTDEFERQLESMSDEDLLRVVDGTWIPGKPKKKRGPQLN